MTLQRQDGSTFDLKGNNAIDPSHLPVGTVALLCFQTLIDLHVSLDWHLWYEGDDIPWLRVHAHAGKHFDRSQTGAPRDPVPDDSSFERMRELQDDSSNSDSSEDDDDSRHSRTNEDSI